MKNILHLDEWPGTPDEDKAFYMAVIDGHDRLTFVNAPFFQAFQQARAPFANKAFLDMIHRQDVDRVGHSFSDCRRDGGTVVVEARVRNGHYKWVKWKISPLREGASTAGRLLCLGYDIAGEAQHRKYSSMAGRDYQSIMEGLNIGWLVQDKDGAVIAANQRAAEILGTTLEKLYNDKTIGESPGPFFMAMTTGQTQANQVADWTCGDGQGKSILWNSQPLFENEAPDPYAVVSTLHDITKEKTLEKEVQAREALFASFMDHTPYVSWIVDEDCNLVYANRSLLKFFHGWKEVLGKNMSMFIPQPLFLALREKHGLALREKRADHAIIRSVMADGKEHVFRVSVFPIHGASRPLAGGEALDITESYTARQEILKLESQLARQKLKQQKNTAEAIIHAQQEERARLGHEMHDNVNQILASAQLFIGQLDPANSEFDSIKARSIEIVGLAIEELRQLAGDMVMPDFKEEGLLGSIRKLVDELKVCKRFDIRFLYNNKEGIESLDPNLKVTLFRIVQEQVKNIIKYSEAKNLVIDLSGDRDEVRLEIADDGLGFDPEKTRRGLGLSNIFERTSLYNGKVTLTTAPGAGCTLIVSIPTV